MSKFKLILLATTLAGLFGCTPRWRSSLTSALQSAASVGDGRYH